MIGATSPGENIGFDSFAATSEDLWRQMIHRVRRGSRTIRNETNGPPEETLYQIRQMTDCEEIVETQTIFVQQPYSVTAAESILERPLPGLPWTIDPRDAPNRTTCYGEQERLMASTVWQEPTVDIRGLMEVTFRAAEEEPFKDGMESEFSRQLTSLVRYYGNVVLDIVSGLIVFQQVSAEVASVALRTLGEMRHPLSRDRRLRLLKKMLGSSSPWIRDGAALGLAWLDDPSAIPALEKAIEQEAMEELRRNMKAVLEYLART